MKKTTLVLTVLSVFLAFSFVKANDAEIVRSILSINKIDLEVSEIAKFKEGRIIELNLDNKDFSREGITILPSEIGKLTELRSFTINDNDLTTLPKEIFNLTKLTVLEIKNNDLISLPPGIRKLTRLQKLDLRNNELAKLPREIGELKSLVKLQLWGNELKQLPSTVGNLSSLKELYLRGNKLTGLPVSITRLRLTYLDVLDNHLCNVPEKVIKWLEKYDKNFKSLQFCYKTDYRVRFRYYSYT